MASLRWRQSVSQERSVRRPQPAACTHPVAVNVLYSAQPAAPPQFALKDLIEGSTFPVTCNGSQPYGASPRFRVASYTASIFPQASYSIASQNGVENPPLQRPFPPTRRRSIPSRYAPWERVPGSPGFHRSSSFRSRSAPSHTQASAAESPSRFPLAMVPPTRRSPQRSSPTALGRQIQTSPSRHYLPRAASVRRPGADAVRMDQYLPILHSHDYHCTLVHNRRSLRRLHQRPNPVR